MTVQQLLRLYPRAWRARYGDEFVDITGERQLSVQQTIDIVMGAIDARLSNRVRGSAAGVTTLGGTMIEQLKMRCVGTAPRYTNRDALIGAGVMILGTALLAGAGMLFPRDEYPVLGDVLRSLAFPLSLTLSMPFWLLKGQPKKAVIFTTVVTSGLLFIATWIATKI